jgi:hypothetical protein
MNAAHLCVCVCVSWCVFLVVFLLLLLLLLSRSRSRSPSPSQQGKLQCSRRVAGQPETSNQEGATSSSGAPRKAVGLFDLPDAKDANLHLNAAQTTEEQDAIRMENSPSAVETAFCNRVMVCVGLGDCKAYRYSCKNDKIMEVSRGNRIDVMDATDPGLCVYVCRCVCVCVLGIVCV